MLLLENFLIQVKEVLNNGAFGMSFTDMSIIIFSIIFALFIREIFAKILLNKIKKIILATSTNIDDKLFNYLLPPLKLLPIVIAFLITTVYFDSNSTVKIYFQKINSTLTTIFVFWLFHQSLITFSSFFSNLEKILTKELVLWISRSIKYLIIFLGVVAVLEVWGIKIGPIIAGLGLFGVAVALGAQDLFKNLISGIMILLEKRFHIGDVIKVPGHTEGVVEHIGFRSTLIKKFDSTPITIPNYIFAEAPILNFSNRSSRRINWIVGLEYNSSLEQIKKFTDHIYNFIKENPDYRLDESHKAFVKLDKFNESSIDILIYCFTSTNDWEKYLQTKEMLAFEIKSKLEKLNLNFAYPSQSIYIEKN